MLKVPQILVRTLVLAAVVAAIAACGQKGQLVLPTERAAVGRATLPQTLKPRVLGGTAEKPPASAAAPAPAPTPAPATESPPLTPTELVPSTSFDPVTSSPSLPPP